jgi:hypothetical protein
MQTPKSSLGHLHGLILTASFLSLFGLKELAPMMGPTELSAIKVERVIRAMKFTFRQPMIVFTLEEAQAQTAI